MLDVYRSVHICTSSFVSVHNTQVYRVVRSSDEGDLSRRNPFDHVSFSNEGTTDIKKELDEIDKKFDEARGA